jgi:hypothetical protein
MALVSYYSSPPSTQLAIPVASVEVDVPPSDPFSYILQEDEGPDEEQRTPPPSPTLPLRHVSQHNSSPSIQLASLAASTEVDVLPTDPFSFLSLEDEGPDEGMRSPPPSPILSSISKQPDRHLVKYIGVLVDKFPFSLLTDTNPHHRISTSTNPF